MNINWILISKSINLSIVINYLHLVDVSNLSKTECEHAGFLRRCTSWDLNPSFRYTAIVNFSVNERSFENLKYLTRHNSCRLMKQVILIEIITVDWAQRHRFPLTFYICISIDSREEGENMWIKSVLYILSSQTEKISTKSKQKSVHYFDMFWPQYAPKIMQVENRIQLKNGQRLWKQQQYNVYASLCKNSSVVQHRTGQFQIENIFS